MDVTPGQGSLERLGIPVETTPSEGVVTPGSAKSIRFRVSRPEGYAYADVESFIFEILIPSLDWYSQTLHSRDLAVHKLGEELDKAEINSINLKAQLEQAELNTSFGSSVQNAEADEEVSRLVNRISSLEIELEQARQGIVPAAAPEGEYYSREEVENYINEAVTAARAEEKTRNVAALAAARSGSFTQADVDNAVAQALANVPAAEETSLEGFYTHEEVQQYIDEAVATARAEEQKFAKQNGYTAEDMEAAVAASTAEATKGLYTADDVEEAVAEALANMPAPAETVDQDEVLISTLTDEPDDMKFRAENAALRTSYDELKTYTQNLERYVASLEGNDPDSVSSVEVDSTKKTLPPITAEDLN